MPNPTGVAGLDAALCGGFPTGRTTIITGAPGSGKTVLSMQYLTAGAALYDEPGLLVCFEESPEAVARNWKSMSTAREDVIGKTLHILDGRVPSDAVEAGTFDLGGLIAVLASLVKKHGIKRLALDGIDTLFAFDANAASRRRELLRVLSWLGDSGLSALLVVRAEDERGAAPGRFDFIDFAADGVIQLRSAMVNELLRRTLRVLKLRGASFVAGDHPYTISQRGITVLSSPVRTRLATTGSLSTRLSTGIERLDRMLEGGYRAGTLTVISGLPGTSKTTLGAAFLRAGCLAGERVQFVGFDEPAEQMIYDVRSVGIELAGFEASGLLRAESFAAGAVIADEHYLAIEALIDEHRPERIVVDPISALLKAGGSEIAELVTERLAVLCKARGITAIFTAVSDSSDGELESAPARVSTIADTWIHLSFAAQRGERNRTLTVIKARGTAHSNQLREILLSDDGVDLANVDAGGGDVLLGTARLRREQEAAVDRELAEQSRVVELRTLDEERDDISKNLEDLRRRLGHVDDHRVAIVSRTAARGDTSLADAAALHEARFGDPKSDALGAGPPAS